MRTLSTPPPDLWSGAGGALAAGSFEGPLPRFDARGAGALRQLLTKKAWFYGAISHGDIWISFCVVHLGYAATAFVFAYDLRAGRMVVDRTAIAPPFRARVADDPHADGGIASFRGPGLRIAISRSEEGARGDGALVVRIEAEDVDVDARMSSAGAPRAISAVSALASGRFNTTEKRAPLEVSGRARVAAESASLDGALGGYDFTCGLLERRTRWRWAFGLGRVDGAPFAFNLVSGFMGEAECAVFSGGQVRPLSEAEIALDVRAPLEPWRVTGEGYDMAFAPGAVHAQTTNLGVVRSRFLQPVGVFTGTMVIDGTRVSVSGLPGVVEDQDVVW